MMRTVGLVLFVTCGVVVLLNPVRTQATTVKLVCTRTTTPFDSQSYVIDYSAGTVTDERGTYPATVSELRVSWRSKFPVDILNEVNRATGRMEIWLCGRGRCDEAGGSGNIWTCKPVEGF
jgi:hypothetical protein